MLLNQCETLHLPVLQHDMHLEPPRPAQVEIIAALIFVTPIGVRFNWYIILH